MHDLLLFVGHRCYPSCPHLASPPDSRGQVYKPTPCNYLNMIHKHKAYESYCRTLQSRNASVSTGTASMMPKPRWRPPVTDLVRVLRAREDRQFHREQRQAHSQAAQDCGSALPAATARSCIRDLVDEMFI